MKVAALVRDRVNEEIFVFALSSALISRPDTRSLRIPPIWEVFPDKFTGKTKTKKSFILFAINCFFFLQRIRFLMKFKKNLSSR